ncbi:hypothetical protein JZ751_029433 [Albula glossodonta]|uniref:Uncharacterized protein n=1 Tax=Albula glossodonta TaxID=121402 RepID=A0A8T2P6H1_9TELE|nr:hypothetical protein JZ751_029433 [Albula glossodonta]
MMVVEMNAGHTIDLKRLDARTGFKSSGNVAIIWYAAQMPTWAHLLLPYGENALAHQSSPAALRSAALQLSCRTVQGGCTAYAARTGGHSPQTKELNK